MDPKEAVRLFALQFSLSSRNVLVHQFICKGTIEEKIDGLISAKKSLSEEIIGTGNELVLSELSDEALLSIVKLDIHRALGEGDL